MTRSVVLVAGPPCAGKTTLVERLRRPTDLVADFDAVARALGSAGKWMHTAAIGDAAEREMERLVDVAAAISAGSAWVIRCVPDPDDRAALAQRLQADRVLVLKPPMTVLFGRATARPAPTETKRAIWRWLDRYSPYPGDELVRE